MTHINLLSHSHISSAASIQKPARLLFNWLLILTLLIGNVASIPGIVPEAHAAAPELERGEAKMLRRQFEKAAAGQDVSNLVVGPTLQSPPPNCADNPAITNNGIVYVATRNEIRRARDFYTPANPYVGAVWQNVLGNLEIPPDGTGIVEMVLDPSCAIHRAWVALGNPSSKSNGSVWRTDSLNDENPVWQQVLPESAVLSAVAPGDQDARAWVKRIQASSVDDGLIFAAVVVSDRPGIYLWRSDNWGETWSWSGPWGTGIIGTQPVGFELSDHNGSKIWLGTIDDTTSSMVLFSNDGGETFSVDLSVTSSLPPYDIHVSPHNNSADAIRYALFKVGGSVQIYYHDLNSWQDGQQDPEPETTVYNGSVFSDPYDNSTVYFSRALGNRWEFWNSENQGVDLSWLPLDSLDSAYGAAWVFPGKTSHMLVAGTGTGEAKIAYTTNGGTSWTVPKTESWGVGYGGALIDGTNVAASTVTIVDAAVMANLYPPFSVSQSAVVPGAAEAVADGFETIPITVTIKDDYGEALSGRPVSIEMNGTGNTHSPLEVITDGNGVAVFQVSSTVAEIKEIIAVDNSTGIHFPADPYSNEPIPVTVTFVPGPVDLDQSELLASGAEAAADGVSPVTVTAVLKDSFGNRLDSGIKVNLTASGGAVITPTEGFTDANGEVSATITNTTIETITVSASVGDSEPEMLSQTQTITFRGAEIVASKTGSAQSNQGLSSTHASAGYPITYTILVRNEGLLPAENVTVIDTLPAEVDYFGQSSSGGFEHTSEGDLHRWSIGGLSQGQSATIDIVVDTHASYTGDLTNLVQVTTTSQEANTADNSDSLTTIVELPRPNLEVSPVAQTVELSPGETRVITGTIRNHGTEAAWNITVSPPDYISWVGIQPFEPINLNPGESTQLTVTISPPNPLASGYYRDLISVNNGDGLSAFMALTVLVRGDTRTVDFMVTNDRDEPLPQGVVNLEKISGYVVITGGEESTKQVKTSNPTDESGVASFVQLETGNYAYEISAPYHRTETGTIEVLPGSGTQVIPPISLSPLPIIQVTSDIPSIQVKSGATGSAVVTITNPGVAPLQQFSVTEDSSWVSLGLRDPIPDLGPGESMEFYVYASPDSGIALGNHTVPILLSAGSPAEPLTIEIPIEVISADSQAVRIVATDEEGQTLVDVAGSILLTPLSNSAEQSGETILASFNGQGEAIFDSIKPGEYEYTFNPSSGYMADLGSINVPGGSETFVQPIRMTPDPIIYDWQVTPLPDDEFDITLRLTYDVNDPEPVLMIPPQTIDTCSSGAQSMFLYNTSGISMTLNSMEITGLNATSAAQFPQTLLPHEVVNIPITASEPGEGRIGIEFEYLQATSDEISFTFNPSSATSPLLLPGVQYQRQYFLDYPDGGSYTFSVVQPPDQEGPFNLSALDSRHLQLDVDVPLFSIDEENLIDQAVIEVREVGNVNHKRSGILNLRLVQDATGIYQLYTDFDLGPIPFSVETGYGSGLITVDCFSSDGYSGWNWSSLPDGSGFLGTWTRRYGIPGSSSPAYLTGSGKQQVRLQLSQSMMMEGDSFNAELGVVNFSGEDLGNVNVQLTVRSLDGQDYTNYFGIESIQDFPLVDGQGKIIDWILTPDGLNLLKDAQGNPLLSVVGTQFTVQASITYTSGTETITEETYPTLITLFPSPELHIVYQMPFPDEPCTVFNLKATIYNEGLGAARNLRFTSPELKTLASESGYMIGFHITEITVNGSTVDLSNAFTLSLGNLEPGSKTEIVWRIETTEPGRFVEFTSGYQMMTATGRLRPPKLKAIHTYLTPTSCGSIPPDATFCADSDGCFGQRVQEAVGTAGGPINTRTGVYDYSVIDLSFPTAAGSISFERWYSSFTTGLYTDTLGYGWTHNLDTRLIFPEESGREDHVILAKIQSSNRYEFYEVGEGVFQAFPGLCGTLTTSDQGLTYQLQDKAGNTYFFDQDGRVTSYSDPYGNLIHYTYDPNYDYRLSQVVDQTGLRFLSFNYDPVFTDRILSVSDHTGRTVTYGYDPATGDLITVTDVLGQVWTYEYADPLHGHYLTSVKDPDGKIVESTVFDEQGRATRQYDGEGNLVVQLTFNPDGSIAVVEWGIPAGHAYDERHTLINVTEATGASVEKTYDLNFALTSYNDPGQRATTNLDWDDGSNNLLGISIAGVYNTTMEYDSLNNLTVITDTLGNRTTYQYDGRLLTQSIDALSRPTAYTYTDETSGLPLGLLVVEEDAAGRQTRYGYDEFGQRRSITDTMGTTYYDYDNLGRLVTVTDPKGHKTTTCYDAAGRVTRTVYNTISMNPCQTGYPESSTYPEERIQETYYDVRGNAIASVEWILQGDQRVPRTTRTYYDQAGRPEYVVENLDTENWGVEEPVPPLGAVGLEQNLTTQTAYDEFGNPIARIEWYLEAGEILTSTTRTFYDPAGRVQYTVENLKGDWRSPEPPRDTEGNFVVGVDFNRITEIGYDDNGNTITSTVWLPGGEKQVTATYYDLLNRPIMTMQSLDPGFDFPDHDSVARDPGAGCTPYRSEMVSCTETVYDGNSNGIATIDANGTITRTYYDGLNRPVMEVRNRVYPGGMDDFESTVIPAPESIAGNTENVTTQMVYDEVGNTIATIDWVIENYLPVSLITRTYFDGANRPITTVVNLDPAHGIANPVPPECNRDRTGSSAAYNLCTVNVYDEESGDLIATIDPLGSITRTYLDDQERPEFVVRNLSQEYGIQVPEPPIITGLVDENLTTQTLYDSQGRTIASVDPFGRISRTYYDLLDRAVTRVENFVFENGNVLTTTIPAYDPAFPDQNIRFDTVYGARGSTIATIEWLTDTVTRTHRAYLDGLGRQIITVANLEPGYDLFNPAAPAACNQPGSEYNLCTETRYDGNGNVAETIDPLGNVTRNFYDGFSRLVLTVQNYDETSFNSREDCQRSEGAVSNICKEYAYDILGNRVFSIDAKGAATKYEYDPLGRLTAVIENYAENAPANDEQNVRTEYGYDSLNHRISILDANGHLTTFRYDALGRLIEERDPLDHTWQYGYDAAGNRVVMTDAQGAVTHYRYDGVYRLVQADYSDPVSPDTPDADVSYAYNALGWRTAMTDTTGVTEWVYDGLGQPVRITTPMTGTVEYSYDAMGNRTGITYPDGKHVLYSYNSLGRLVEVMGWDGQVAAYTYDLAGNPSGTSLPNGVVADYQYDGLGQLTSLQYTTQSGTVSSYEYVYDANGNRVSAVEQGISPGMMQAQTISGISGEFSAQIEGEITPGISRILEKSAPTTLEKAAAALIEEDPTVGIRILSDTGYIVVEDSSVEILVRLSEPATEPVSVAYRTTAGTAQEQADYLPVSSTLTFEPGETDRTLGAFAVRDAWSEAGEYFTFELFNPVNAILGNASARVDILDGPGIEEGAAAASQSAKAERLASNLAGILADTYSGYHDGHSGTQSFAGCVAGGWMRYDQDRSRDLTYRVLVDGVEAYRGLANVYRADLTGVCTGGTCAYGINLADIGKISPNVNHTIIVQGLRLDGTWFNTTNTPKILRCDFTATNLQGRKKMGLGSEVPPATNQIVSVSGIGSDAGGSPYYFNNLPQRSYTVSISVPSGYRVGYSLCYNSTTCHGSVQAWRNTVTVYANGGYIDLYWHFELLPTATLKTPTLAPTETPKPPTPTKTTPPPTTKAPTTVVPTTVRPTTAVPTTRVPTTVVPTTPVPTTAVPTTAVPTVTDTAVPPTMTPTDTAIPPTITPTHTANPSDTPTPAPTLTPTPTATPEPQVAYNYHWRYRYDALNRLTYACAEWDPVNELCLGEFFEYGYDAAGNMTSKTTQAGAVAYAYDAANRLSSVNGLAYTWDANGNLVHDGVNTYSYDRANRMTAFSDGQSVARYSYNGSGDRVAQTVNGVTTRYTLDLASGLTQVLSDGSYTYLYGAGRIAQVGANGSEYFLGDALGSVRQVVDAGGAVALSRVYEPYGEILWSAGEAETSYAFTGEQYDSDSGLIHLRARWYAPQLGRFTTKDTWQGAERMPMSYNPWLYVYANPINFSDPTGKCVDIDLDGICDYGNNIDLMGPLVSFSYGSPYYGKWKPDGTFYKEKDGNSARREPDIARRWEEAEKATVRSAAEASGRALAGAYNDVLFLALRSAPCEANWQYKYVLNKLDGPTAFYVLHGGTVDFVRRAETATQYYDGKPSGVWAEVQSTREIYIFNNATSNDVAANRRFVVHELGHAFENALEGTIGIKAGRQGLTEKLWWRNGIKYGGFAGPYQDWQWSKSEGPYNSETGQDGRGEIFADMYIGWVYRRFGDNELGAMRAGYMGRNMPLWVYRAITIRGLQ